MSATISRAGLVGSAAALLTAACCVLPMALVLLGLGGSWIAVFGIVAAASLHVIAIAAVLTATGWILALRRRAGRRTYAILGVGTGMTFLAWLLVLNEAAINDYLITLM
jgi:hypothetical protein